MRSGVSHCLLTLGAHGFNLRPWPRQASRCKHDDPSGEKADCSHVFLVVGFWVQVFGGSYESISFFFSVFSQVQGGLRM